MTESINWSLNIQVIGGPKVMASDTKEIEAYDKIEVTIEADTTDKEVEIQPGGADKVQFLLIKSDTYSSDVEKLTYKVNELTTIIELDALQVFIGNGAVELLTEPPEKLVFTNKFLTPVSIEILVGRMATSPL
ncbi:MAG TPA: hypothetical protein VMW20_00365 [Candidatus Nanoarchaeia archaeon]|nr:hypothetical protein [Candidatus Nanoarchaeia archaeon]